MAEKKLMVVVGGKTSDFEKAMNNVQKKLKSVSRDLKSIGEGMTQAFTVPIVAAGGAAIKVFADFEQTMTQSTAIMGNLSEDMRKKMEYSAREIAKTTKFSAVEAAEAYEFLALAGLDVEQSIAALPQVAAFAQAGNFDLARATDLATDAQSALGMTSKDASENLVQLTRVTDVLTRAATLANANTEQFSEALTEKAGVAMRQLGIDIEEGSAALAVFADQGVKGGQAGTTLNATLEGLSRQAIINKDIFKEYNVEVFDAEGTMRNLADITEDLEKALGGMSTEEQRATLMKMGFNRQALNGIQMLMGNSDAIREYENELRIAGGTTQDVADKQMNNLWDQLGLIKDRLVDAGIELGSVLVPIIKDSVLPALEKLIEFVGKLVEWFGNLSPKTQKIIVGILAVMAAIGPLLFIVGSFMGAIANIMPLLTFLGSTVLPALGAALGAISAPVLIVIGVIAALIAIGVLIWKNWDTIKEKAIEIWGKIKDYLGNVVNTIVEFYSTLPGRIWTWLVETFNKATTWATDMKNKAIETGANFLNSIIDFVKQLPGKLWTWLTETIKKVVSWAGDVRSKAIEAGRNLLNSFINEVKGLPGKLWNILLECSSKLLQIGGALWENAKRVASNLWEGFKSGLGISSPSYIEEALMAIQDTSKATVAAMSKDFRSLASLPMPGMAMNYALQGAGGIQHIDTSRNVHHSGTITVKGINNHGELIGAVDIVLKGLDDYRVQNKIDQVGYRSMGRNLRPQGQGAF